MRDRFVTDTFVLDLSRISISYQEENPRYKDTFFTQFSMPFEFRMNADLRTKIGNYTDLNASDLKKKHEGYHIIDGVDYLLWWKYRHLLDDSYNDSFIITNI